MLRKTQEQRDREKEVGQRRGLAGSRDLGEGSLKKARTGRESIYGTNLMSSTFYYSPILLDIFFSVLVLSINLFAVG